MSDSKIQVKVGIVEFSGEGNQDWLAKQLDKILDKVPELLKIEVGKPLSENDSEKTDIKKKASPGLSALNIAGKIGAKSGPEVTIAAAAYLHFIKEKALFSRDELSAAMKEVTGIFKNAMLSNLTKILAQLEKVGTFNKSSTSYSLNATKVSELNAILFK